MTTLALADSNKAVSLTQAAKKRVVMQDNRIHDYIDTVIFQRIADIGGISMFLSCTIIYAVILKVDLQCSRHYSCHESMTSLNFACFLQDEVFFRLTIIKVSDLHTNALLSLTIKEKQYSLHSCGCFMTGGATCLLITRLLQSIMMVFLLFLRLS